MVRVVTRATRYHPGRNCDSHRWKIISDYRLFGCASTLRREEAGLIRHGDRPRLFDFNKKETLSIFFSLSEKLYILNCRHDYQKITERKCFQVLKLLIGSKLFFAFLYVLPKGEIKITIATERSMQACAILIFLALLFTFN